jgi:hypothetical protein
MEGDPVEVDPSRYRHLEMCERLVRQQEKDLHALRVEVALLRTQLKEVAGFVLEASALAVDEVRKAKVRKDGVGVGDEALLPLR